MQKNSITNKITPCCGLPFSVIYWWVSNLTLNSKADRSFVLSKIGQNGTISIDGWKVLVNSGTLEADASLTKAEFLKWFDCGKQPTCEQLKLIIEGFKIGGWTPETELPSNLALIDKFVNGQNLNGNVYTKEQVNQLLTTSFGGDLVISDNPKPKSAKWYFAKENGTYPNAGGLVVDLTNKLVILNYDGTNWSKVEVEVDLANVKADIEDIKNNIDRSKPIYGEPSTYTNFLSKGYINKAGILTTSDAQTWDYYTDYIPVKAGDIIKLKAVGDPGGINIISYYSAQSEDSYVSGVVSKSRTSVMEYIEKSPIDGYIRCYLEDGRSPSIPPYEHKVIKNDIDSPIGYEKKFLTSEDLKDIKSSLFDVGNESFKIGSIKDIINLNFTTTEVLPTTKGTKIKGKIHFQIGSLRFEKFATFEVQGSSSAAYPKKNWTIAFYNDPANTEAFSIGLEEIIPHDELVFKSDWIDATHGNNSNCNRLWEQIQQSRDTLLLRDIDYSYVGKTNASAFDTGAIGQVRNYASVLNINGGFYGIGNLGVGKKRANYNLKKSDITAIQLSAIGHCDMYNFNPSTWELRNPSLSGYQEGGAISDSKVMSIISALFSFNSSSQSDFKTNFKNYYNLQNAIDYYIFFNVIYGMDIVDKNFILTRYNERFFFMPYDLDSTMGLWWSGDSYVSSDLNIMSFGDLNSNAVSFWNKFYMSFKTEIIARYNDLKAKKVLSAQNISRLYTQKEQIFTQKLYIEEFKTWNGRPSLETNNKERVVNWFKDRITYLDSILL